MPFRVGGLPGVNLSEQGNAGWKRCMMSLVRAAKVFATMVLQERQMHMFNNNPQASDGRGPSQAENQAEKLRAQREREEDEFVHILDDDYAIILGAIQSENPEYHLPKAAEKHRPKKSTKASLLNSQKRKQDDEMNKNKKIKMITPQHLQHQHNNQYKKYQLSNKKCNCSDVISGRVNTP